MANGAINEYGYTGDGFTEQAEEDRAEQEQCERAVENSNRCPSGCECPVCGERNMDKLAIQDDETVICDCGHHYDLADCGFGDDN